MNTSPQYPLVLSYLALRRLIGAIGILLPFVLAIGTMTAAQNFDLLTSISAYYYSVMRDVFVGSLCAVAVFLFAYRYDRLDDLAGDVAAVFALGVALFPVAPAGNATVSQVAIGWVHIVAAAGFFATLAFFAIVLFRRTDRTKPPTQAKRRRNIVYLCCGLLIVACLVLLAMVHFLPPNSLHLAFWLEALALLAFGVAWFVKGETILKDP